MKSATSNPAHGLETPVQFVKGVGPKMGSIFASRGIATVGELLRFFPRAYQDRSKRTFVKDLEEGVATTVEVEVLGHRRIPLRNGRTLLEARTRDQTGILLLKWFYAPKGLAEKLVQGTTLSLFGTPKKYLSTAEMLHPELSIGRSLEELKESEFGGLTPVYVEIEGVATRTLRKILFEALQKFAAELTEDLPEYLLKKHSLVGLQEALRRIHFPQKNESVSDLIEFKSPSQRRLIFEELFKFELHLLRQKMRMEKEQAPQYGVSTTKGGKDAVAEVISALPFELTGAQKTALDDILADLAKPFPANRLIQGDVGSGKTAVAFCAAAAVCAEGDQVALMAPTEILAEQHFKNAQKILGRFLNVRLLTGKTPAKDRTALLDELKSKKPLFLIGTHALLEDPVQFNRLGLFLIDEQHRFGVEQRRTLRLKGQVIDPKTKIRSLPHAVVLSATPIPRTLALTLYGDLSISSIRELPPGRTPIKTHIAWDASQKEKAYQHMRELLQMGRQVYMIFPLVEESEAEGFTHLKSATIERDRLESEVFKGFKVGLLHGQMKPDEKAKIMDAFYKNEIHVLVSTTVVEVGVDVPNACVIAVEHAERFGLSQLHQLRGRVGRGGHASFCYLFTNKRVGEATQERLSVLEKTSDGFEIAEADLRIRGPGEFLGVRQSGALPFQMANLVRDRDILETAITEAKEILERDPNLEASENLRLKRFFEREGKVQSERFKTS